MKVIALVGFKGSGKDTAAKALIERFGFKPLAYADALKDCISAIFCWPRHMMEGDTKESREWREQVDPWWAEKLGIPDFSPRKAMQLFGTDTMRKHFDEQIWITNVERRLHDLGPDASVIIKDGRFFNELDLATSKGGQVVRVKRGPDPVWYEVAAAANKGDEQARWRMENEFKVHESEWAWIGYPLAATLENEGSVEDLYTQAAAIGFALLEPWMPVAGIGRGLIDGTKFET